MKKYVAAMDIGTSGCKSIILDEDGVLFPPKRRNTPCIHLVHPGMNRNPKTGGRALIRA